MELIVILVVAACGLAGSAFGFAFFHADAKRAFGTSAVTNLLFYRKLREEGVQVRLQSEALRRAASHERVCEQRSRIGRMKAAHDRFEQSLEKARFP